MVPRPWRTAPRPLRRRKIDCTEAAGSPDGVRTNVDVAETLTSRDMARSPASPRVAPHPLDPIPAIAVAGCAVGRTASLNVTTPAASAA